MNAPFRQGYMKRPEAYGYDQLTIPGGCGGKEVIKEVRKIDPKVKAIVAN